MGSTHPKLASATPLVCELKAGDSLFIPKGWHHAVVSEATGRRNLAVNTWYDMGERAKRAGPGGAPNPLSSLRDMFQAEGC